MFRRLHDTPLDIRIRVDGREISAASGDSVASALMASGITALRTSHASGAPRGAYCGMGVCFECLVTIDGVGNQQACMTPVRNGMVITTGSARRDLTAETGA